MPCQARFTPRSGVSEPTLRYPHPSHITAALTPRGYILENAVQVVVPDQPPPILDKDRTLPRITLAAFGVSVPALIAGAASLPVGYFVDWEAAATIFAALLSALESRRR